MSGTNSNSPPGANGGGDPSMEDILASIRRILSEDEPAPDTAPTTPKTDAPPVRDSVLVLDSSMLAPTEPDVAAPPPVIELGSPEPAAESDNAPASVAPPTPSPAPTRTQTPKPAPAPAQRQPVRRNIGPSFEEAVRDAFQPVIKQWLDTALPKMVERMVRTEVERIVGGSVR